jgi:hypothetical protein
MVSTSLYVEMFHLKNVEGEGILTKKKNRPEMLPEITVTLLMREQRHISFDPANFLQEFVIEK